MLIPHPIPYQGSKRRLAGVILRHVPRDAARLVEPFAGSAAVSLAAAAGGLVERFVLNDANEALMTLWAEIIDAPERLASAYSELWHEQKGREREFYDEVRERFNRGSRPADLLYLLARCVKASVRYNANGEFNQSPDNRRRGARPHVMRRHIVVASRLLRGRTTLSAHDYEAVLCQAEPSDLVYMDPPYQGVCGNRDPRYAGGVCSERFVEALRQANERELSYILSYDGKTGEKEFGRRLPPSLGLRHIEVDAGRSSQATLLGRDARTIESLYLSPALVERMGDTPAGGPAEQEKQLPLLVTNG